MKTKHLIPLLSLVCAIVLIGHATAVSSPAPSRVVYHIDYEEPIRQSVALRSIVNQLAALEGQPHDLRVVLHGRGVSMLLVPDAVLRTNHLTYANAEGNKIAQIRELRQQGVTFWVCSNSLKRYGLGQSDLHPGGSAYLIPNGIAELARLQSRGYAYIKP